MGAVAGYAKVSALMHMIWHVRGAAAAVAQVFKASTHQLEQQHWHRMAGSDTVLQLSIWLL
jgi:hypothetical protein